MSKLLVCCDGSWNDESDHTHIFRIADAGKHLNDPEVKVYYDSGVGTDNYKLTGGALGKGLSANVRQAYAWLIENWKQGDQIFAIGFSRGAYTVRSLCGFMHFAGLLQNQDDDSVDDAYTAYRLRDEKERYAHRFRSSEAYRRRQKPKIQFLGVFDTVGSLGIPVHWFRQVVDQAPLLNLGFHDTKLSAEVETACHALAIDERRGPFEPTLWTGHPHQNQMVKQVWFSGVHSDIGGGYEDKMLSTIPLSWMLHEMKLSGLDLFPIFTSSDPLPSIDDALLGIIHDSMDDKYRALHKLPSIDPIIRPIGPKQRDPGALPVPGEILHWSVRERIEGEASLTLKEQQRRYSPENLVLDGEWQETGLIFTSRDSS